MAAQSGSALGVQSIIRNQAEIAFQSAIDFEGWLKLTSLKAIPFEESCHDRATG
jgi:hypothetical protein